MNKTRIPISEHHPRRVFPQPAMIVGAFLALHLLLVFWRPNPLWGVDLLFYVPARGLFILLAVLLFIPGFRRQTRAWLRALPFTLWGQGARVRVTRALVLLVALAAFFALPSARHFLGDGYHVLEKLDADTWHDMFRAPLTVTLIRALHNVGQAFWETAENTYRVYSCASGALYVLISFPVAAALGKTPGEKTTVLAFLLTAGYMQLFFGYVENYALYMPGLLLYLLLGLRTLENRMPLSVPALLLGMLLVLHRAFVVFGPSLLVLAYCAYRHRQGGTPPRKNALSTVAALCCVPVSAALFLGLSGIDFAAYLSRTGSGEFLPVFAEPGFYAQYRIFSLTHFLDFLNQQLLSAPAACLACVLLRKKDFRHHSFLAVATIFPLFFTFLAKPNIGAFRDWDIFSLPALPLTLWVAAALLVRIRDREHGFHTAFLFCGGAALHTLLWVSLNASAGAAEARYVHLMGRLTGHASATGWLTLGKFYERQDNTVAALDAYKRALHANPTNSQRWLSVGIVYMEMGQPANAIGYLERAVELRPDLGIAYVNLGVAYNDLGQPANAIQHLERAVELRPDLAITYVSLGAVYRNMGQHAAAIEALEKAVALRPDHAIAYVNLGAVYNDLGQPAAAIEALERAVALQPDLGAIYLNLGVAYNDLGQPAAAIECFERAVALQPDFAIAYVNLGAVYNDLGQPAAAIAGKSRCAPTGPRLSQPGRRLNDLGQPAAAIECFERAVCAPTGPRHRLCEPRCRLLRPGPAGQRH